VFKEPDAKILHTIFLDQSRTVTIAMGCWFDGRDLIPGRVKAFPVFHTFHYDPEAHTTPYPRGTYSSFPGSKAAEAWISLHGTMLNDLPAGTTSDTFIFCVDLFKDMS
jgi:hypothetical protein